MVSYLHRKKRGISKKDTTMTIQHDNKTWNIISVDTCEDKPNLKARMNAQNIKDMIIIQRQGKKKTYTMLMYRFENGTLKNAL